MVTPSSYFKVLFYGGESLYRIPPRGKIVVSEKKLAGELGFDQVSKQVMQPLDKRVVKIGENFEIDGCIEVTNSVAHTYLKTVLAMRKAMTMTSIITLPVTALLMGAALFLWRSSPYIRVALGVISVAMHYLFYRRYHEVSALVVKAENRISSLEFSVGDIALRRQRRFFDRERSPNEIIHHLEGEAVIKATSVWTGSHLDKNPDNDTGKHSWVEVFFDDASLWDSLGINSACIQTSQLLQRAQNLSKIYQETKAQIKDNWNQILEEQERRQMQTANFLDKMAPQINIAYLGLRESDALSEYRDLAYIVACPDECKAALTQRRVTHLKNGEICATYYGFYYDRVRTFLEQGVAYIKGEQGLCSLDLSEGPVLLEEVEVSLPKRHRRILKEEFYTRARALKPEVGTQEEYEQFLAKVEEAENEARKIIKKNVKEASDEKKRRAALKS